jgi:hypothetical protein
MDRFRSDIWRFRATSGRVQLGADGDRAHQAWVVGVVVAGVSRRAPTYFGLPQASFGLEGRRDRTTAPRWPAAGLAEGERAANHGVVGVVVAGVSRRAPTYFGVPQASFRLEARRDRATAPRWPAPGLADGDNVARAGASRREPARARETAVPIGAGPASRPPWRWPGVPAPVALARRPGPRGTGPAYRAPRRPGRTLGHRLRNAARPASQPAELRNTPGRQLED